MTSTLPDLKDLVIAPASQEQMFHYREMLRPLWSPNSTTEEYLIMREIYLNAGYSANHRRFGWVLAERKDPTKSYSYIETGGRDAWSKDSHGNIRDEIIYSIQWVVTPEEYRRKGYSSRLLRMVHYFLAPSSNIGPWPVEAWGPRPDIESIKEHIPDSHLSHLSSLAPPGFYEAALVGPDEDQRPGWISTTVENHYVVWDLNISPPDPVHSSNVGSNDLGWTWIYRSDIPTLTPEIAEAHLEELKNEKVDEGQFVYRLNPASPDILIQCDHMLTLCGAGPRALISEKEPIGIRWFSSATSTTESPPPMKSSDPLVLLMGNGNDVGEMFVTLLLNCTSQTSAMMMDAILKGCQDATPKCTKIIAFTPPPAFAEEIVKRGGTTRSRLEDNFFPHGTAWYGPKGTGGYMMANEAWQWA